jgi:dipeptidyl aminopeptidase/acylaminoacyl peptidase
MPHLFPIERYLNVRAASSPSFSPDGRFVAYLSNTTGIPQAWLIPVTGGEPTQLTFGADAVRGVHFSPVRDELIFSMDTGGDERAQLYRLYYIADGWDFEALTSEPKAIHAFGGWSRDGTRIAFAANREDGSRFDIYVQEIASGDAKSSAPKLLAIGPGGYYTAAGWSPDDKYILVERTDSNVNQDLHVVEVATGGVRHLTPHKGDVQYQSPVWVNGGNAVFCSSTSGGRDTTQAARIDIETGEVDFKDEYRHEVEQVSASRRGKWVSIHVNAEGSSRVLLCAERGEREMLLPAASGVVTGLEFSPDESRIAFTFDGPWHNPDVWTLDLSDLDNEPLQLTHSGRAGLPFNEFVEPELIHYKTFDGREIPAWWYQAQCTPADAGGSLGPVIVYPHGGPESQTRPNFTALFQYFLARGYSILAPNVRGSSGYGTAFMNLDNITKRMDSVSDLAYAAHWIREQKKGDPKRIAVYGGSYGGFMVLAALTHYPDLWAAGIDVVGIANFVTFLEKTGDWRRAHREKEYGNLSENRDFLVSISPLNHVDKIRCPLMVIHGANDPRVPVGEAEQIVAALKQRGVPVEYLRYEDEGHGLVKLKNRLDAYPKMAAFLDRHLKK